MKTFIWSVPVRFFHWFLAIGFTAAYILSDFEKLLPWHMAFGAFVGCLLFFRILFGFFGPKYVRFSDFPMGFTNQLSFVKGFFSNPKAYAGHNPAASVVMLAIFIVGILASFSGFMLYSAEHPTFINPPMSEHDIEELHEIFANLFLVLVGLHLAGLLAEAIFHSKEGTIKSMFSGYKNLEAEPSKLTSVQKIFVAVWLVVPFVLFYLAFGLGSRNAAAEQGETNKVEQGEHEENDEDDD
ncbi:MAG TPA: hypothetical protein DCQ31_17630 [Bacteroidales bacterium]|nr:hypothetical protein [Bacteroidales bacterium]